MIARRYAKALLNLAVLEKSGEAVKEDMAGIRETVKQRQYLDFLSDRTVPKKDKMKIFDECRPLTKNFLTLVIESKKERQLQLMAVEYIKLINRKLNMEDVEVMTKTQLSDKEKEKLKHAVEKHLDKKVHISYSVDKGIIGGISMKYGSNILDGTVPGILMRLLEELTVA